MSRPRYISVVVLVITTITCILGHASLPAFDARDIRITEARRLLAGAAQSMDQAEQMYDRLDEAGEGDAMWLGYKAMAEFLISRHSYNPITKMSRFNSARTTLEKAIVLAPKSVELRFLRFTIQNALPGILGYQMNLHEDRDLLMRYVTALQPEKGDEELFANIKECLLNSGQVSGAVKERVREARFR